MRFLPACRVLTLLAAPEYNPWATQASSVDASTTTAVEMLTAVAVDAFCAAARQMAKDTPDG